MSGKVREKLMSGSTREKLLRATLVFVLLAGVVAVTFGGGYRASQAAFDDASAYMQKDHSIVRINAPAQRVDAQAQTARRLATGKQQLEVVQLSPGVLYVVNKSTGAVDRLSTTDLQPQPVSKEGSAAPGGRNTVVAAGGGSAYVLDPHGNVTLLEGPSGTRQMPVALPPRGPASQLVVDGHGTAWAFSRATGRLFVVVGGRVTGQYQVTDPGEQITLTLADDRPIIYRPQRGEATMIGRNGPQRTIRLPRQDPDAVSAAAPGADSPVLVVAARTATGGLLIKVDFGTGAIRTGRVSGPGAMFGRPVVSRGRVYLPERKEQVVLVHDLRSLRRSQPPERVRVSGPTPGFEIFARDGRVWVNDPYSDDVLVFDRNGTPKKFPAGKPAPVNGNGNGHVRSPGGPPSRPRTPVTSPSAGTGRPVIGRPGIGGRGGPRPGGQDDGRGRPASRPQRPVGVPAVVGRTQSEAEALIKQAELRPRAISKPGACTPGTVTHTDPAATTNVERDSIVVITVCGPSLVPNVVGMPIEQARQTLQKAGFTTRELVGGTAATLADIGKVITQTPLGEQQASTREPVTVTYIDPVRGSQVQVPNLSRMTPEQACATLTQYKLVCNGVADAATREVGVVHSQQPQPGAVVAGNTPVEYVYETVAPTVLNRWKLRGRDARYLSVTPRAPSDGGDWSDQTTLGMVYNPGEPDVPGLININQWYCNNNCGQPNLDKAYYYSRDLTKPGPGRWSVQATAFSCFGNPVPGTAPLYAMRNERQSWGFAAAGSNEHDYYLNNGYSNVSLLCYIWLSN
ncbi:PASTA domain-containing protein [Actinomadura livida]|uniref:PASTA domain-containing protein n=1 Tax=Actinomadura livida TaxID=79909 RepID=A0A7W7MUQ8_9ACTN|nr:MULTISPECIES: PASTA domain-containing protein [Actinomadura]MBB4771801.1 hypothetical protein [Actinomadura catellatispora]GGU02575.1 hypothetical protein GCM10010208_28230 [Actinomadura livida]